VVTAAVVGAAVVWVAVVAAAVVALVGLAVGTAVSLPQAANSPATKSPVKLTPKFRADKKANLRYPTGNFPSF
jgi:hypothetical protein